MRDDGKIFEYPGISYLRLISSHFEIRTIPGVVFSSHRKQARKDCLEQQQRISLLAIGSGSSHMGNSLSLSIQLDEGQRQGEFWKNLSKRQTTQVGRIVACSLDRPCAFTRGSSLVSCLVRSDSGKVDTMTSHDDSSCYFDDEKVSRPETCCKARLWL